MAQSVKQLTLDFGSGHDLMVREFEPHIRLSAVSTEPAWDPLSPSLSAPPPLMLFLKINLKAFEKCVESLLCVRDWDMVLNETEMIPWGLTWGA